MTAETLSHLATTLQATAAALANHLWQSTVFAAVVGLLTLALRSNQARARHWLWMTASLKFLLPLALLTGLAAHLEKPRIAPQQTAAVYSAVEDFSEPFAEQLTTSPVVALKPHVATLPLACAAVWLAGFLTVLGFWSFCWLRIARTMRRAEFLEEGREIDALRRIASTAALHRAVQFRVSSTTMEPGVFGILRPVLAWPAGLSARLDDAHLEGILAHEVCHVRRRDNLAAALHMFVEAAFWFYPLVWWIGARLLAERERACDEEVLLLLARPREYAESILKVCEYCVESPLACVSGVTGADLKQRVREIMSARTIHRLTWTRKLLLLATAAGIAWLPIALAQAHATQRLVHAALKSAPAPIRTFAHTLIPIIETPSTGEIAAVQPDAAPTVDPGPSFDVATIRPTPDRTEQPGGWMGIRMNPSGRVEVRGITLENLAWFAFQQGRTRNIVIGATGWMKSQEWDIEAKVDDSTLAGLSDEERLSRMRPMMRTLLKQRFHLAMHTETRVTPVEVLVQAKGGAKLKQVDRPSKPVDQKDASKLPLGAFRVSGRGDWVGHAVPVKAICEQIEVENGEGSRIVVDETGLTGFYDFSVHISFDKDGPTLEEQIEDQLGLKLEPRKMPLLTYVIDSAEKPSVDGAEVQHVPSEGARTIAQQQPNDQTLAESAPRFEVVSVRPSKPGSVVRISVQPDGYTAINIPLKAMISNAYGIRQDLISGAPAWTESTAYDLDAKEDEATAAAIKELSTDQRNAQIRVMLQAVLEDRFRLKVTQASKESQIYDLVIAKGGTRLKDADPNSTYAGGVKGPGGLTQGVMRTGPGQLIAQAISMQMLANNLQYQVGRSVIDRTGLTGKYDFTLKWATDATNATISTTNESESSGPSIFTAIQEQLGLALTPAKGTVPVLVIDHIEKPTPN